MIRNPSQVLCGLLLFASVCHAAPTRFQISGEYRGGISLDFGKIGATTLDFQPQKDGSIRVTGTGRVNHPREKEKILEFALDMAFRVEGNWVRTAWSRNTSNEHGKKLLEKIERIMPFLHVATLANGAGGQRHFYTKQGLLGVTTTNEGDQLATVVEDGPRTLVTLYAKAGGLSQFKVPTKEGAILSFVADRPLDFAARADD